MKNIVHWWGGGICKCPGANAQGSPGSTPGMAADKCISCAACLIAVYLSK